MPRRRPPEPIPDHRLRPAWLRGGAMASVVTDNGYEVIGVLVPLGAYGDDVLHMPVNEGRSIVVCVGDMLDPQIDAVYPYVACGASGSRVANLDYTRVCDGCALSSVTGPGRVGAQQIATSQLGWHLVEQRLYCPECVASAGLRALRADIHRDQRAAETTGGTRG